MKKIVCCFMALALLLAGCSSAKTESTPPLESTSESSSESTAESLQEDTQNCEEGVQILLSDDGITVDGQAITTDESQAVYTANDIVFYLAGQDFTYGEGSEADGHEQSEADAHTVVHITKPGCYVLSGKLSLGQIAVDLGEDAETDPEAVVTLVLDGVDITCTVAPAVIFYNVYECCSSDAETATKDVDTQNAGANVVIADGTENTVRGSYVAKIYKSYELNADGTEVVDSKKLHKYDGAFYSKKTLNIGSGEEGTGVLNIIAENEGLGSELHLTVNGGTINITSGNDGINTNEDGVSVTTVNGGTLNILCSGSTGEGDGIDSNGWLVINGGTVTAQACSTSGDAGIDSDMGIYLNGGTVVASGHMLDQIAGGSQTYVVFSFAARQEGDSTYSLKNSAGETVGEYAPDNAFSYLIVAGEKLTPGEYTFWQGEAQLAGSQMNGMGGMPQGERPGLPGWEQGEDSFPAFPEGEERPEMPHGGFPQGEIPEMPEGEVPSMPGGEMPGAPGGWGGIMGNPMQPGGETSSTFTIVQGGNRFFNVGPAVA